MTVAGGTNISTSASNDTITINFTGTLGVTSYNALSEVQNTGRTIDKSYMPAFAMIRMNNVGNTAYSVDSHGYTGNNPTIYAIGGMTIAFDLDGVGGHPFEIQDGTGTAYSTGLTHVDVIGNVSTGASANGQDAGTLYWEVPETISGGYRYQCTLHASMVGAITVKRISII
jgi:plastocyanin